MPATTTTAGCQPSERPTEHVCELRCICVCGLESRPRLKGAAHVQWGSHRTCAVSFTGVVGVAYLCATPSAAAAVAEEAAVGEALAKCTHKRKYDCCVCVSAETCPDERQTLVRRICTQQTREESMPTQPKVSINECICMSLARTCLSSHACFRGQVRIYVHLYVRCTQKVHIHTYVCRNTVMNIYVQRTTWKCRK